VSVFATSFIESSVFCHTCVFSATISVAVGPSGENLEYLERLDSFLLGAGNGEKVHLSSEAVTRNDKLADFDDDTVSLSKLARHLRDNYQLFFLFGAGSNQHNQIMLSTMTSSDAFDMNVFAKGDDGDVNHLTEMIAAYGPVPGAAPDVAITLLAGGGNTGILTSSGRLFLFGWNDSSQLGTSGTISVNDMSYDRSPSRVPMPMVLRELQDMLVESASLGFSHTLVIEKNTKRLFGFGSNEKGQVHGESGTARFLNIPATPSWAIEADERFVAVAAGVFHSAAVTTQGELVLWGCRRSIGCHPGSSQASVDARDAEAGRNAESNEAVQRWKPRDGGRIVQVACGRMHTVAVDDQGRVWTLGDARNKHGQLGRRLQVDSRSEEERNWEPKAIELPISPSLKYRVERLSCGWYHTVVQLRCEDDGSTLVYGFGRNDRGQLGTGSTETVRFPRRLFESHNVQSLGCGSEFTAVVDDSGKVWSCGWNEHGNLATGDAADRCSLAPAVPLASFGLRPTPRTQPPALRRAGRTWLS
jgi:alpha-tubulin suppressor-like RCC1 family protein